MPLFLRRQCGRTAGELQDCINELDADGTGSIEWEEFAVMMVRSIMCLEEELISR